MSARFRSEGTCFLFARNGGKCTLHARRSAGGAVGVLDDDRCIICDGGDVDDGFESTETSELSESSELLDVFGVIVFVSISSLVVCMRTGSSSKSNQKIVQTSSISN